MFRTRCSEVVPTGMAPPQAQEPLTEHLPRHFWHDGQHEAGCGVGGQLFVMVGMVGVGETSRAREIVAKRRAVRITPEDCIIPLHGPVFGDVQYPHRRDVIERLLTSLALNILRAGTDVVRDFGRWARDERSALR